MNSSLLITDTHPLAWYIKSQSNKLPLKVKKAFDDAVEGRRAIFIPAVVLWELSNLIKAEKLRFAVSLEELVEEHFFAKAISIRDIATEDILLSHQLNFSRDPFDSLIVAMAIRAECPLITGDNVIHKSKPCEVFWG